MEIKLEDLYNMALNDISNVEHENRVLKLQNQALQQALDAKTDEETKTEQSIK